MKILAYTKPEVDFKSYLRNLLNDENLMIIDDGNEDTPIPAIPSSEIQE